MVNRNNWHWIGLLVVSGIVTAATLAANRPHVENSGGSAAPACGSSEQSRAIEEWKEAELAQSLASTQAGGGRPNCPPLFDCPKTCTEGTCSSNDMGVSACNLQGGGVFNCQMIGETVHWVTCDCDGEKPPCGEASSRLECE